MESRGARSRVYAHSAEKPKHALASSHPTSGLMPEANPLNQTNPGTLILSSPIARMYHAWNEALSRNDVAALTALYAPHAEDRKSHLMDLERCMRGHEELRAFFEGGGEQMDFVEVMELNNEGLIQKHRVYWGWFGIGVLKRDAYHK